MYSNQCEHCGAFLDYGERCDCLNSSNITEETQISIFDNGGSTPEIMVIRQLPVISENLRSLHPYIQKRLQDVLSMPCTEDTVKQIKEVRAQLNKEFKELEDRRKEIKTTVIRPYMQLEETYRDCVTIPYKDADNILRDRISHVEMEILSGKAADVASYFEEYVQTLPFIPDGFVDFDRANIKVNMSTSLKKMKEQAKTFLDRVNADCEAISLEEHSAEIMVEYQRTLNLPAATLAVKRRKEAAKAFVSNVNPEKHQEQVKEDHKPNETEPLSAPIPQMSAETEYTVTFSVTATSDRIRDIVRFLRNGGYTWKQVK